MEQRKKLSSGKWLWMFVGTVLLIALLILAFNYVMDPYGAFGDRFFGWWSYDETLNPRLAKITYLEQNHEKYDSYIIGSSGSSSYPVELLNKYLNASFYNCFFYGTDMEAYEQIADYLAENYTVKNLVLNLSPNVAAHFGSEDDSLTKTQYYKVNDASWFLYTFKYLCISPLDSLQKLDYYRSDGYLQQPYRVFNPQTGAYDKSKRDAEPIGTLADYVSRNAYKVFTAYPQQEKHVDAQEMEESLASVRRICELCEKKGIRLLVLCQPNYWEGAAQFSAADQASFRNALAQITDYWDFTLTPVSYEPRYFYDATHFRNCVGAMVLARVFGDGSVYVPEGFGEYVPRGSVPGVQTANALPEDSYTKEVPILMYHNIAAEPSDNTRTVTAERFAEQLRALCDAGYVTVGFDELRAYVEQGTPLPEKPVVITFDDGYLSNYELAYPILKEYGCKATLFAIGVSMGKDSYKDTGLAMQPHFSLEQAAEMEASGLISVQSHGYNVHETKGYDPEPIRFGVTQRDGETEAEYVAYLQQDCENMRQLLGKPVGVFSYPLGTYTEISEVLFSQEGIWATVTTVEKNNQLIQGLPQCLRQLSRLSVNQSLTGEALIEKIENAELR